MEIPADQWRSTTWRDDPTLPSRFGIVTSNTAEATNNVFQAAREGSWLFSLDYMLGKMMERISLLRQEVKEKDGVVQRVADKLTRNWNACAGYKVLELTDDGGKFTITRRTKKDLESTTRYIVDVVNQRCSCGEWQEYCYPCIDALAYFWLHKNATLNEVLGHHVEDYYTYKNAREMLRINIHPVCMDAIKSDGVTLPPKASLKRSTGRPKKQRIRKRSRWAENPEESNVVCSKCKKRGHNIRTCDTRAWMEKQAEKTNDNDKHDSSSNQGNIMDQLDLS